MSGNRLVYQNWIVELGGCPDQVRAEVGETGQAVSPGQLAREKERQEMICREVADALLTLTDDEKEFIERFYYCGQTYIAAKPTEKYQKSQGEPSTSWKLSTRGR